MKIEDMTPEQRRAEVQEIAWVASEGRALIAERVPPDDPQRVVFERRRDALMATLAAREREHPEPATEKPKEPPTRCVGWEAEGRLEGVHP